MQQATLLWNYALWFSDNQRKGVASGEHTVSDHGFLVHAPWQRHNSVADDTSYHKVVSTNTAAF
jgi:hypothetical protein